MKTLTRQGKSNLAVLFMSKEGDPWEVDPTNWNIPSSQHALGNTLSSLLYDNETLEDMEKGILKAIKTLEDMRARLVVFGLKNEPGNFE